MPKKTGVKLDKDQYSKSEVEDLITKNNEETNERLEIAELVAEMSDAEKDVYKSLEGEDKDNFLFASSEDRAAIVSKRQDDDPVVYTTTDGMEIRKSDGAKMLKMAKDNDATNKRVEDLHKAAEKTRLETYVKENLQHLPGDLDTRVEMVKAVEGIKDEKQRTAALDALKANNAKLAKAFTKSGTSEAGNTELEGAEAELDSLAKAYQKENPDVDYYTAYEKVAETNPELYQKAVAGGE